MVFWGLYKRIDGVRRKKLICVVCKGEIPDSNKNCVEVETAWRTHSVGGKMNSLW